MFVDGWTAAARGNTKRLEELLDHGDHDIHEIHATAQHSLLHVACLQGNEQMVGMLLRRGIQVDTQDAIRGDTALHKAVSGGYGRIVQMLITVGADKYIKNNYGFSPLDLGRKRRDDKMLYILGDSCADRAKSRGLSMVANLMSPTTTTTTTTLPKKGNQDLDNTERLFEVELEYIEEVRKLERKYQMVHSDLNHHQEQSDINRISFENAIELLSNRELEIEELKQVIEHIQKGLHREAKEKKRLENLVYKKDDEIDEYHRKLRNYTSLERKLENEKARKVDEKRVTDREKQLLKEKAEKQEKQISNLQQKLASVETEWEKKLSEKDTQIKELQDQMNKLVLQMNEKDEQLKQGMDIIQNLKKEDSNNALG